MWLAIILISVVSSSLTDNLATHAVTFRVRKLDAETILQLAILTMIKYMSTISNWKTGQVLSLI